MDDNFVDEEEPQARPPYWNVPLLIWSVCAATLLLPSILVWIVRGSAYVMRCVPNAELCYGHSFGGGLRDTLGLAWGIPNTSTIILVGLAFVAATAALFARKPLLSAASMLLLPIAALVLPMIAVLSAIPMSCTLNEAGVGECTLWGADQNMSFHHAVMVQSAIYGFAPYSFALSLMMGILGWFFARPHHAIPPRVETHGGHHHFER